MARSNLLPVSVIMLALPLLALAGCGRGGSAVTKQTADRIQTGMPESDVVALLGAATNSTEISTPDIGSMLGAKMPEGRNCRRRPSNRFGATGKK